MCCSSFFNYSFLLVPTRSSHVDPVSWSVGCRSRSVSSLDVGADCMVCQGKKGNSTWVNGQLLLCFGAPASFMLNCWFATLVTRAVALQRNRINRCPGWAQQCTNSRVHICRKNLPTSWTDGLSEDYPMVLWCNSLLKHSDGQSLVGRPFQFSSAL